MTTTDPSPEAEAEQTSLDDAIWPVPEGTLMTDEMTAVIDEVVVQATNVEKCWLQFTDIAPVKAAPEHEVYVHDLAVVVDTLETAIDHLRAVQVDAAERLARAVPYGTPRVGYPGLRPLIPRYGGERKGWRNDLLAPQVERAIRYDPETGEARDADGVHETWKSVFSILGGNAKRTGLKALGIDPDDYCIVERSTPTVQVVK